MKIIYENKEIKNICQNEYLDLTTENALKHLNSTLGNKIRVFNYSCSENHIRTMKVENLSNHTTKNVTIKYDDRKHILGFRPFGISHLAIIMEDSNDEYLIGETYEIGNYACRKYSNVCYNQTTNLQIEEIVRQTGWFNNYNFKKDNQQCTLTLKDIEPYFIFKLLEVKKLDLFYIYETMKSINDEYLKNITIETSNINKPETEELSIREGELTRYEKTYQQDDNIIKIIYNGEKILIKTEQEIPDNDIIKTNEINVTEEIQNVKKLIRHK